MLKRPIKAKTKYKSYNTKTINLNNYPNPQLKKLNLASGKKNMRIWKRPTDNSRKK